MLLILNLFLEVWSFDPRERERGERRVGVLRVREASVQRLRNLEAAHKNYPRLDAKAVSSLIDLRIIPDWIPRR